MTRDTLNFPTARSWRDIPQPVVPRAMSREGRWRLVMSSLRVGAAVATVTLFVWGAWLVAVSVSENTRAMPAAAKATPMKAPELRTDGVLTDAWLARTLALPRSTSLMELDLQKLQGRLLADNQVLAATLTKKFPDRLIVQIAERGPIARVMVQWMGRQTPLLVARDGVVYAGEGYDRSVLQTLPWLDGVKLTPQGGGFQRLRGMEVVADLLGKARLEAEQLYATWGVVSLARLDTDHQIEVHTKDGLRTIYFTTRDDFFRQLAKLDYIVDSLAARTPPAKATIDLTFGENVPVMAVPLAPEASPAGPKTEEDVHSPRNTAPANDDDVRFPHSAVAATAAETPRFHFGQQPVTARSEQAFFVLPPSQPRNPHREL